MKWFKNPYKSYKYMGESYCKILLPPDIKSLFDLLVKNKGMYIGIRDSSAFLYINDQPPIKVKNCSVDDVKELCDDVKEYEDLNEYRMSDRRIKQVKSYYQVF